MTRGRAAENWQKNQETLEYSSRYLNREKAIMGKIFQHDRYLNGIKALMQAELLKSNTNLFKLNACAAVINRICRRIEAILLEEQPRDEIDYRKYVRLVTFIEITYNDLLVLPLEKIDIKDTTNIYKTLDKMKLWTVFTTEDRIKFNDLIYSLKKINEIAPEIKNKLNEINCFDKSLTEQSLVIEEILSSMRLYSTFKNFYLEHNKNKYCTTIKSKSCRDNELTYKPGSRRGCANAHDRRRRDIMETNNKKDVIVNKVNDQYIIRYDTKYGFYSSPENKLSRINQDNHNYKCCLGGVGLFILILIFILIAKKYVKKVISEEDNIK